MPEYKQSLDKAFFETQRLDHLASTIRQTSKMSKSTESIFSISTLGANGLINRYLMRGHKNVVNCTLIWCKNTHQSKIKVSAINVIQKTNSKLSCSI